MVIRFYNLFYTTLLKNDVLTTAEDLIVSRLPEYLLGLLQVICRGENRLKRMGRDARWVYKGRKSPEAARETWLEQTNGPTRFLC